MPNFLYTLFIYPLVQIIEVAYMLFYKTFNNPGAAILGVSSAVTLLCLPLYAVAEKWQGIERDEQKRLAPMVQNIRAAFKGDERFMILQEYYRQNRYRPVYALRGSFGILIQIPFFMAAYSYLSGLEALKGAPFLFIRDLGSPDAFSSVAGFPLNALPVLMTAVNVAAGAVYAKGFPLKDKVQLFAMAGAFLVLLYNSPSGLVLYWTMNNVFSLAKNVFYRLKNPLKALYLVSAAAASLFICYLIFFNNGVITKRLLVAGASSLVLLSPLFVKLVGCFRRDFLSALEANPAKTAALFLLSSLALSILAGLCIPSAVISSSPDEFSYIDNFASPLVYLGNSFLASFGLFTLWPACLFFLFGRKTKTLAASFFALLLYAAIINAFPFQGNYGIISNVFRFETTGALNVSPLSAFLNVLSIAAAFVLAAFALKKKWLSPIISAGTVIVIAFSIFSGYNSFLIQNSFSRLQALQEKREEITSLEKTYSLSRSKRNVIIVMTDTAISGFLKPIFDARPELYDDFKGFTYYPNTVSFSKHTLMGVPPIWGGFEYTPLEMNKKREATLKEKHNQSLLTLPVILSNNGYEVTVTDPSWANYEWTADTSIYDGFENIKAFNSIGRYTAYWYKDHEFGNNAIASTTIKRNSLFFSFMMIIPPPLRFAVYDKGHYWGAADKTDAINGLIDNYAPLDYLPNLMSFDADKPQALFITNELAHQPYILQYPDYRPVPAVTDRGPGVYRQNESYHSNAALLILLSKWLRELKRQNVYNNTRIIIVADHGAGSGLISDIPLSIQGEHREGYNPLLLVKDFDSLGDFSEDPSFMTTADTPILALKGIVDEPENPFTGKPLSSDYKKDGVFITTNHQPMKEDHGKYQFNIKDDQWVFVKDDIKKADNWKRVEPQINEYND